MLIFIIMLQYHSLIGMVLEDLTEQSVLTLHFRFTSELVLQVNGKLIGCIATIPRRFSQIYPAVDLYGTICQVCTTRLRITF